MSDLFTEEQVAMNALWPRVLKSVYRKEPLSGFILTMGAVDAVIGGVDSHWSLLFFGLGLVGVAVGLRIWRTQQSPIEAPVRTPIHSLPSQSSRQALPMLSTSRRHPPQ